MTGVAGRAIPVPRPVPVPYPIFSHILASGPTHGQMKAILMVSMRFPRKGPEWVPDMPQNDLRMTLRMTLRYDPQTGPEMASDARYPDLRYPMV